MSSDTEASPLMDLAPIRYRYSKWGDGVCRAIWGDCYNHKISPRTVLIPECHFRPMTFIAGGIKPSN